MNDYSIKYHQVMNLLQNTKIGHGLCLPRERRACTACNAEDDLKILISEYNGAPVTISNNRLWMPIDTTPEGEHMLLFIRNDRGEMFHKIGIRYGSTFFEGACVIHDATHWMPLPARPKD